MCVSNEAEVGVEFDVCGMVVENFHKRWMYIPSMPLYVGGYLGGGMEKTFGGYFLVVGSSKIR